MKISLFEGLLRAGEMLPQGGPIGLNEREGDAVPYYTEPGDFFTRKRQTGNARLNPTAAHSPLGGNVPPSSAVMLEPSNFVNPLSVSVARQASRERERERATESKI